MVSKIAMQTRLRRVARAVAPWAVVLVLGGCSQVADGPSRSDTPEDPATFGPADPRADPRADPTEETARAGEIVHTGQTIVVEPGAQVISNGTVSTGETSTAGMELAAIVKDGKAYLYHPALGNVPLSRETSLDALAYRFFRNQAVPSSRYAAAVGYDYSSTATGLRVRQRASGVYQFENPTSRWQAVHSPADPNLWNLPPTDLLYADVARVLSGKGIQIRLDERTEIDVSVRDAEVELYASVFSSSLARQSWLGSYKLAASSRSSHRQPAEKLCKTITPRSRLAPIRVSMTS